MMKNASLQRHAKARKSLRLLDQPFLLNTSDHGQATARRLLPRSEPGSGFAALWQCGALDLMVEARPLRPAFADLFTEEECMVARKRLVEVGYAAGGQTRT